MINIPTIYITRNGLLEPLGQSQVLAYLRGLSIDYQITLITYEKDEDWLDVARIRSVQAECSRLGVNWLPQRFRSRPKLIAPVLSMFRMAVLLRRQVKVRGARLIHARSYIPAAVAMFVGALTRVPFIFDMRALWPEELITAGRLQRGSVLHRAIVAAERSCIRRSAAVVLLTNAAVDYLSTLYPGELPRHKVAVIPTCADLSRFSPAEERAQRFVIGCVGTLLSGWFRLEWLAKFLSVASTREPKAEFEIITRDDPDVVRAALDFNGQLGNRLTIVSVPHEEVHLILRGQTASVMFYAGGQVSELGRSPTRMAEVLGCGLPVVVNDGVGDVAHIVRKYRVGVIVQDNNDKTMQIAWTELGLLLQDSNLAYRCRKAAEVVFSLESGTAAYAQIYDRLITKSENIT